VRIDYVGVRYYGEAMAGVTFGIQFNASTNTVTLDGLTGIAANPTLSNAPLGLSCGSAGPASNSGPTNFLPAGGGCIDPTAMLYDFVGSNAPAPFLVPSLVPGTLNTIIFTPQPGGGYCWSGM
jgi:hypothetical protein